MSIKYSPGLRKFVPPHSIAKHPSCRIDIVQKRFKAIGQVARNSVYCQMKWIVWQLQTKVISILCLIV